MKQSDLSRMRNPFKTVKEMKGGNGHKDQIWGGTLYERFGENIIIPFSTHLPAKSRECSFLLRVIKCSYNNLFAVIDVVLNDGSIHSTCRHIPLHETSRGTRRDLEASDNATLHYVRDHVLELFVLRALGGALRSMEEKLAERN